MTSVYNHACSLGYPYRWGDGRMAKDGATWLSRFQKSNDPNDSQVIFLGYNADRRAWVQEPNTCSE